MRGSETPASFTDYVHARRPALLRTAYLLCGDLHDAEDLVQVALTKVVPRWRRNEDDPEPYVRTVLVRENVPRHRRRRWREVPAERVPETASAPSEGAEDLLVLDQALRGLAPRQRAVVVLRYLDDLSVEQTAEVLGVSPGTVKSQASDALRRLRSALPDDRTSDWTRV